jgi:hypothetical protein
MSNVLSEAEKQQVIALGRLGWPRRRIEEETGVRQRKKTPNHVRVAEVPEDESFQGALALAAQAKDLACRAGAKQN